MLFIRPFVLLSTLFFTQGIQSYCVYNRFTDGSSFTIHQDRAGTGPGKAFYKHLEEGTKFCCPYTEKDCSRNLVNDDEARFIISIHPISGSYPAPQFGRCTTGGALLIRGTAEDYHGECVDVNGVSTIFRLEKLDAFGQGPDYFLK